MCQAPRGGGIRFWWTVEVQNVSALVESWDGTSQQRLRCTRKPLEVHRHASVNAEFSDAVQFCGHSTTCGSGVAGRCWKAGSSSTYSESCFESARDGRRNPFGRALYLSVLSDQGSAKRTTSPRWCSFVNLRGVEESGRKLRPCSNFLVALWQVENIWAHRSQLRVGIGNMPS